MERFWRHVRKTEGCWLWIGATRNSGYGQFWEPQSNRPDAKNWTPHRFSWVLHFGQIQAGKCVLHHCDVKLCVRPDHLFLGTHTDNMADCKAKGRNARGDTHYSRTKPWAVARGDRHSSRTHPERMARGENNGNAKLTAGQVLEIRHRRSNGETLMTIADRFCVPFQHIGAICQRKVWQHI